ncbi:hypothetical protein WA026_022750 [Henosepilachna vigintioctopunctata]|uniref:Uncharacterized protein n=1 Tax=Henosepilachna vigintioctopunctata TaxID=420089 RepID=A0AAW1UJP3_9CUCU
MFRHVEFLKYEDERMRNYKRKTERGTTSEEVYESGAAEAVQNKTDICKASEMFNLCPISLVMLVRKYENNESCSLGYVKPRLVWTVTSAEQVRLVTVAVAINAQGGQIYPLFVFPLKRYQDQLMREAPVGSAGAGAMIIRAAAVIVGRRLTARSHL